MLLFDTFVCFWSCLALSPLFVLVGWLVGGVLFCFRVWGVWLVSFFIGWLIDWIVITLLV